MFVSEYLNLNAELKNKGIFDSLINKDSHFFINITRLKDSKTPEFSEAYKYMNEYFFDIATLLEVATSPDNSDKMYREARRRFTFNEVNGINLGFSANNWGAGWGDIISDQVLRDAFQIVKSGSKQPEIFQLVGLFEDGVASDRLSDMIATIIEPYIKQYTLRMLKELNINQKTRPNLTFSTENLVINQYKKGEPILLLPEEILHELPIARNWNEIDWAINKNESIRREINTEIGETWEKWASSKKKDYIRERIFMNPEVCKRVISDYRKECLPEFNPMEDPNYFAEVILKKVKDCCSFKIANSPSSFAAAIDVINIFKDWVENNRGWAEIQDAPTKKREKSIQRYMHLGSKHYLEVNDLDSSFECNAGSGAVDLKISRGNDKTVIEVKLSSNPQYLHGFLNQIKQYEKAEETEKGIYVFVDLGNPIRREKIVSLYEEKIESGECCPRLMVIDATTRDSASIYWDDASDNDWNVI